MTSLKTISEKLAAWRRYRGAVRELSDRDLSDIGIRRGDIATWRRYRGAVRELSKLSDRDLSDIGIRRGDIETVVRQSM